MIANLPTYDEARKAIRDGKNPMAFLYLGIIYANGFGIIQNHILACYFYKKALDLGCLEAERYMNIEYESGIKDFATDINSAMDDSPSRDKIANLKKRIEQERMSGNYGNLSKTRKHLPSFYPSYNKEKAISDILHNRETTDADILYSLCTSDNQSEIYIDSQESVLKQLYAPISMDKIAESMNTDLLSKDESELAQCLVNMTASYDEICQKFDVDRKELCPLESLELFPYIRIPSLGQLRKQAFRCLLSIKDIDPQIRDKYLNCLDCDESLLNICEEDIKDQSIQMFLISFVELNLDIETLHLASLTLLHAFRNKNLMPLADHLNTFVDRLTAAGIKHDFPHFSTENLPPIQLPTDANSMTT